MQRTLRHFSWCTSSSGSIGRPMWAAITTLVGTPPAPSTLPSAASDSGRETCQAAVLLAPGGAQDPGGDIG